MQLTKGKKLHVFFGYLDIQKGESGEHGMKCVCELCESGEKSEEVRKEVATQRKEIIEKLNQNTLLSNVSDLFVNTPEFTLFNPIIFKIHIPFSLQKKAYVQNKDAMSNIEDFLIVYCDATFMVCTITDEKKYPFGVWDVRDRVLKIFTEFGKVKSIPPTFSPSHVTFSIGDGKPKVDDSIHISIKKPTKVENILKQLVEDVDYELSYFYEAARLCKSLTDLGDEIEHQITKLLEYLTEFIGVGALNIMKKWKVVNKTKKEMSKIICQVSEYKSQEIHLRKLRDTIKKNVIREKTLHYVLLKKMHWEDYTTTKSTLDVDSVFKSIEHVRREIEAFSVNTSAILSALLGGISGSIITLLLTNNA